MDHLLAEGCSPDDTGFDSTCVSPANPVDLTALDGLALDFPLNANCCEIQDLPAQQSGYSAKDPSASEKRCHNGSVSKNDSSSSSTTTTFQDSFVSSTKMNRGGGEDATSTSTPSPWETANIKQATSSSQVRVVQGESELLMNLILQLINSNF